MNAATGRILLVDDELGYARGLARDFACRGWSTRVAANGDEALVLLRTEPADAVLVDLRMPGMDGVSLIERLRACLASAVLFLMSAELDLLAQHFLASFGARYSLQLEFSPRALEALHAYHWPGNVRELRAVVQQAAVLAVGNRVGVAELMAALRDRQPTHSLVAAVRPLVSSPPSSAPSEPLRARERRATAEAWQSSGKNLSAAARELGLPRTTLRDRLRKYGLL